MWTRRFSRLKYKTFSQALLSLLDVCSLGVSRELVSSLIYSVSHWDLRTCNSKALFSWSFAFSILFSITLSTFRYNVNIIKIAGPFHHWRLFFKSLTLGVWWECQLEWDLWGCDTSFGDLIHFWLHLHG